MKGDIKMRIGVYVRVSTEEQVDNYSIEEQIERMKKYCEAKGWIIYKIYNDGGYSGSNLNRPSMKKLIDDANNKNIDGVMVLKLDRLSRSQKDTLYLIEDVFQKNDVAFISVNENFDTSSPFGKACIGMMAVFAQLERDTITYRMSMGRNARGKAGKFTGNGNPPTGYDYVDGELIVNEYEAMQVREVFKLFLEGMPVYTICDIMQNKYTTKKGGNWVYPTSINRVLKSKIYIGMVSFAGTWYEGTHEPIIDIETFNSVQVKYAEREKEIKENNNYKKAFKSNNLLTGILFCGDCGSRMFARKISYKTHKYLCHSIARSCKRMIRKDDCSNGERRWEVGELDVLILNEILALAESDEYLKSKIEFKNTKQSNLEILSNRLKEINSQISRLLDLYQLGNISTNILSDRINILEKEKKFIEKDIEESEIDSSKMSINDARIILGKAKKVVETGTLEDKQILIRQLIKRIVILNDNIDIYWSFS